MKERRAVGIVKFYDRRVNNFGYISTGVTESGVGIENIYFSGGDVREEKHTISDGDIVVFIYHDHGKGKAVDVKSVKDCGNDELMTYYDQMVEINALVIGNMVIERKINLNSLQRRNICKKLLVKKEYLCPRREVAVAWSIGWDLDDEVVLAFLSNYPDECKLQCVEDSPELLAKISSIWEFTAPKATIKYLHSLSNNNIKEEECNDFRERFVVDITKRSWEECYAYDIAFKRGVALKAFLHEQQTYDKLIYEGILKRISTENAEMKQKIARMIKGLHDDGVIKMPTSTLYGFAELIEEYESVLSKNSILIKLLESSEVQSYEDILAIVSSFQRHGIRDDSLVISLLNKYNILQRESDARKLVLLELLDGEPCKAVLVLWRGNDASANYNVLDMLHRRGLVIQSCYELSAFSENILAQTDVEDWELLGVIHALLTYLIHVKALDEIEFFVGEYLFTSSKYLDILRSIKDGMGLRRLLGQVYHNTIDDAVRTKLDIYGFLVAGKNMPSEEEHARYFMMVHPGYQQLLVKRILHCVYSKMITDSEVRTLLAKLRISDMGCKIVVNMLYVKDPDRNQALRMLSGTLQRHMNEYVDDACSDYDYVANNTLMGIVKQCNGRKYYHKTEIVVNGQKKTSIKWRQYVIGEKVYCADEEDVAMCEGRYWKSEQFYDSISKKDMDVPIYYCRGGICQGPNRTAEMKQHPLDWSLEELCEVVGSYLDEHVLATIAGWSNRINEIMSRLVCRQCRRPLRPMPYDPKVLGYYAVPLFRCINAECSMKEEIIRITHCLNGKCRKIVDSRDRQNCDKGWMICECGTCCPEHSGIEYEEKIVMK